MSKYQFRQINDRDRLRRTSKLMLPDSTKERVFAKAGDFGEYMAGFRGALLKLFGEPMQKWSDAAYDYILEATDTDGNVWTLTAYEGASGSAIGGNSRDPSIYPVAIALRDLIEATTPADFEVTMWSDEYGTTTTYGCIAGSCYYYEERGRVPRATINIAEVERQEYDDRIRRLLEANPNACVSCEATGKCGLCEGTGVIKEYWGFDENGNHKLLPPPYGACPECHGTGICTSCDGTGTTQI